MNNLPRLVTFFLAVVGRSGMVSALILGVFRATGFRMVDPLTLWVFVGFCDMLIAHASEVRALQESALVER
jgi:hypothetical protein